MQWLREHNKDMVPLVSCTTRPPRENEINGNDYYFVDNEEFNRLHAEGEFIETIEYDNHRYGLRYCELNKIANEQYGIVILTPEGKEKLELVCGKQISIFLDADDTTIIERLRARYKGNGAEESIKERIRQAVIERNLSGSYDLYIRSSLNESIILCVNAFVKYCKENIKKLRRRRNGK